jgi:hypothetical protein
MTQNVMRMLAMLKKIIHGISYINVLSRKRYVPSIQLSTYAIHTVDPS